MLAENRDAEHMCTAKVMETQRKLVRETLPELKKIDPSTARNCFLKDNSVSSVDKVS